MAKRYCIPCDEYTNSNPCRQCGAETDKLPAHGTIYCDNCLRAYDASAPACPICDYAPEAEAEPVEAK